MNTSLTVWTSECIGVRFVGKYFLNILRQVGDLNKTRRCASRPVRSETFHLSLEVAGLSVCYKLDQDKDEDRQDHRLPEKHHGA